MPSVQTDHTGRQHATRRYSVSKSVIKRSKRGSLVDRGANGGICGNDAVVTLQHQRTVDVTGIDNHELNALRMVDAAGKVQTQVGEVILIMRQYAYHGIGRTIHSAGQIEHYKNSVYDKSLKVGGRQCIITNEGYVMPLDIICGLPYLKMVPPTKDELDTLPHVILTGGGEWDPTVLDSIISDSDDWYNLIKGDEEGLLETPFDQQGNYKDREPTTGTEDLPDVDDIEVSFHDVYKQACDLNQRFLCFEADTEDTIEVGNAKELKPKPIDYQQYRPYFLHAPIEKIRRTFQATTQFASNVMSGHNLQQTIKSPYPAHNVWRRNEPVATDTIFGEVPAVGTGGQKMAQIFVGRKSLVIDVIGMGSKGEFVNTLEDVIRKRGAMDMLVSDSAPEETSARVKEVLRSLCIRDHQSEPYYQHQNFAERRWRHLKGNVQWFMNYRNVDANAWLLCTQWVADVMNHMAEKSLGWRPPLEVLTGQTVDISIMLVFLFWDVVYVKRYKDDGYSGQVGSTKSDEIRGRFVGFAWSVGHALTFKILTDDTKKIIQRSRVRLAKEGENNLKLDVEAGAVPERVYITSKQGARDDAELPTIDISQAPFAVDEEDDEPSPMDQPPLKDTPVVETVEDEEDDTAPHLRARKPGEPNPKDEAVEFIIDQLKTDNPTVDPASLTPESMVDRTFLMPPQEDGTRVRAKIVEFIEDHKQAGQNTPEYTKFRCLINDDYEEIVAFNDIVDFIEEDQTWDGVWKFREIKDHEGPLKPSDKRYKGSRFNVQIEWESGEVTWEPLTRKDKGGIYDADPVTVAIYAKDHGLLDTPGWKLPGLKKLAKTQKRIIRAAHQAKLQSFRTKPLFMYGFQVPRNHQQALELDLANGNTRWQDSEKVELRQIDDYETFDDKGRGYRPGPDYKKIRVHFVYAVKHDGRHKARLVSGGHLTDTPVDSVYSSVVSLRGIRILTFIAELNGMEVWATDIGNAYLESKTKEKVYIVAGPEFGEREGHTLIIVRALYGLKSSGLRWSERLADVLREEGFFPSRAEKDIWMRDMGDHYEYIGVYVDDLIIVSKYPKGIIDFLTLKHKFKLKGTGEVSFHLGCDFFRDSEGVLCYAPRKYIEKILDNYKRIFGQNPKQASSPLVKGDHPELDTSELLDTENVKIYQSLIGALQWVIQIGRFDISTSVMTLSRFRALPRQGHLDRVKRIHGYLSKMRHGLVRIRTEKPDYSDIPEKKYEWSYSCYSGAKEEIPHGTPPPKGKPVITTSYVDANLYHDLISGRSVTGILHMLNKTPIDWYSKLQSTVETATFGSEYVACRTCTEQIIDLRCTLRYLGVPVEGASMMFGDNETVVNTASIPHSKLHKRHNALSYHRTREAIAAGITRFYHVRGDANPADILTKHWDYPSVWQTLKPLMFWEGDTAELAKVDVKVEAEQDVTENDGD